VEPAAALPFAGKQAVDENVRVKPGRRPRQLEKTQESVLDTLCVVSSHLDTDEDAPALFGRLSATIADQTQASRAAFWRLGPRGTLSLQPSPHGFDSGSRIHETRFQLGAEGTRSLERVVFEDDLDLVKGTSPQLDDLWRKNGLRDVSNSIAVPWRAGDRRIGAIAVYDSRLGFTAQDLWLVRVAGMAAGILWQYKETEDDLGQTAVRLEEAMSARRHLLNNIAAGGDEARRRFASALHDDSLQLLTGAELQLERIRMDATSGHYAAQLDQLRQTLRKVEDSLRRLLINVSPEPLPIPNDLREAISERLEQLRLRAGIEPHIDFRLPDDVPLAIQGIVVKNIGEALNNVEKHAHATRVTVVAEAVDGGIRVEVSDNGRGFVVAESVRVPGHIGLVALRERAQLAGGWCRIQSDPGAGTNIGFWLPMSL
jgi:signal transduction histidine kinase